MRPLSTWTAQHLIAFNKLPREALMPPEDHSGHRDSPTVTGKRQPHIPVLEVDTLFIKQLDGTGPHLVFRSG